MKTLLLIEDDLVLKELIVECLEKDYFIYWADSLKDAKSMILKHPFDIILSDVHVLDGNTIDLITFMRSRGILTPLVVQSGDQNFATVRSCLQLGVTDYICKPWKLNDIKKVLSKALVLDQKRSFISSAPEDAHHRKIFGLTQVSIKNNCI